MPILLIKLKLSVAPTRAKVTALRESQEATHACVRVINGYQPRHVRACVCSRACVAHVRGYVTLRTDAKHDVATCPQKRCLSGFHAERELLANKGDAHASWLQAEGETTMCVYGTEMTGGYGCGRNSSERGREKSKRERKGWAEAALGGVS